jgi:hypothetical protein
MRRWLARIAVLALAAGLAAWRADRACPNPDRNTDLGANVNPGANVESGASAGRQVNVGVERSTRPLLLPEDHQYQRLQHLRR